MSRKDCVLLANALKFAKPPQPGDQAGLVRWNVTVESVASTLAGDNYKFDRLKFLTACGYND